MEVPRRVYLRGFDLPPALVLEDVVAVAGRPVQSVAKKESTSDFPGVNKSVETAPAEGRALRCTSCDVALASAEESRRHHKTAEHVQNVHRRLCGLPPTVENAPPLEEEEDISDASSSDEAAESERDATGLATDEDPSESTLKLPPIVTVSLRSGAHVDVRRHLLMSAREANAAESWAGLHAAAVAAFRLLPARTCMAIILCTGGYFAAGVFKRHTAVLHKTLKRYTTRRKAGGTQSSADKAKGAPIRSAGAQLRRHNEARMREDIADLLTSWAPALRECDYIAYYAPSQNASLIFYESSPLKSCGGLMFRLPISIGHATWSQVVRAHTLLTTVYLVSPTESSQHQPSLQSLPPFSDETVHAARSDVKAQPDTATLLEERGGSEKTSEDIG
eukprot:CAMPEP_0177634396 /NCGR_PEP_ID=MMETSP0447-20121125/3347_1 /TAXON_ID=0 /ORGANISM="Stygamoeba regulata, Strain BSH-02190019" /LENGTH=390 /DNA_ID=CAMNT_0019136117 /DNA_START=76 /DNA_END=1244 /DNA_ORIENTATION=+